VDAAIVISYGRAFPDREAKALEVFTEALTFFGTRSHAGECGEPVIFIGPSGKNLILVPGSFEKLAALVWTDEFRDLYTKAVFTTPDLTYEIGDYGAGVQSSMARWARIGSELAYL
jgi:hypothetical protein